ncbi:hypothetical protein IQ238_20990 [Pleurocapsales cyanobacterium LEGE 06147]|nr:hypothetical protein [Pleurocapsales cyanobacterium LEGE 06147]
MNTAQSKIKSGFPLGEYLNQLLFNPTRQKILHPLKFWHLHKLEQLEHCWEQDWTRLLERCWNLEYKAEEPLVRVKMPRGTTNKTTSERDGNIPI